MEINWLGYYYEVLERERERERRTCSWFGRCHDFSSPGHNFRFMMNKTGTARMLRQGMGGKICRAPKVGRV